jgi:DNA-binding SARP family transcriptional activator/TolB-like protein/tetratricopeptide (TPR) repeat protein
MLCLRTFGGLTLEQSGRSLDGAATQRRRLALLAVIAATRTPVSRDRLLTFFWPEWDEERARAALKQALYALRRDLSERDLVLGTTELRLNPDVIRSDVQDFHAALRQGDVAAAAALYRGPLLDGVHIRGAAGFEEWLELERRQLAELHVGALQRLAADADARGDLPDSIAWWRRCALADPLRTDTATALMDALWRSGDAPAALRHAAVHSALVEEEIGEAAAAPVAELAHRIRHAATGARPPVQQTSETLPVLNNVQHPDPEPGTAVRSVDTLLASGGARRRRPAGLRLAAGLAVVVAVAALLVLVRPDATAERIAVLPFANETGDASYDAAGRMMADWLTQGIAQIGVVETVDFRTVLRLADASAQRPRTAGIAAFPASLGATVFVQGTLYLEGDQLVVQTRLVRGADGAILRQIDPVRGGVGEEMALAEGVRQGVIGTVAATFAPRFTAWEQSLSRAPRYDAYVEFVTGLEKAATWDGTGALPHFLEAARLDTTFVQATLFALEVGGQRVRRDSLLAHALRHRDRLTTFDRLSLERQQFQQQHDFEGMYRTSRRLLALAPASLEAAYWHAMDATSTNRFDAAIAALHSVDPRGWLADGWVLERLDLDAHHYAGDFAGELVELERWKAKKSRGYEACSFGYRVLAALGREAALDSAIATCLGLPDAVVPGSAWLTAGVELRVHGHTAAAHRAFRKAAAWYESQGEEWQNSRALAMIDFNLGQWQALLDRQRELLSRTPGDARDYARMAAAAAHLGDHDTARQWAMHVEQMGEFPIDQAIIAAALGEHGRAVDFLRRAIANGIVPARQFHTQPGLDPLRGYPPFDALIQPRR